MIRAEDEDEESEEGSKASPYILFRPRSANLSVIRVIHRSNDRFT